MDWLNYIIFFLAFAKFQTLFMLEGDVELACTGVCSSVGFQDDWEVALTAKGAKRYLSMCVCIQLLKIIKFASELVPKMGLVPRVLKRALPDLIFHSTIFIISMASFSTLFYIELGPLMIDFYDQRASFVALARALYGDFDIDGIMDNSAGCALLCSCVERLASQS